MDDIDTPNRPRPSRFKEHTNTAGSIRPPPAELWKDVGIEQLLDRFNEENRSPPLRRNESEQSAHTHTIEKPSKSFEIQRGGRGRVEGVDTPSVTVRDVSPAMNAAPTQPSESTFGRFSRAFASVLGVLGKRKAGTGSVDIEKYKVQRLMDERKRAADVAYQVAKDQGLLPTPRVFVRPGMDGKVSVHVNESSASIRTPRSPRLRQVASKKDLHKQKKLSKRVSNLEYKLASAKKELQSVLNNENLPPVPSIPIVLPPTPTTSVSENERQLETPASASTPPVTVTTTMAMVTPVSPAPAPAAPTTPRLTAKIAKKRKAANFDTDAEDEAEAGPDPADSDGDMDMDTPQPAPKPGNIIPPERTIKRVKSTASSRAKSDASTKSRAQGPSPSPRRQGARLIKKASRSRIQQEQEKAKEEAQGKKIVTVVPDGDVVPDVPVIPRSVRGTRARATTGDVGEDGYGGLEHEMF